MAKTTGYLDMELLRFTTAGSVDDGKSTLIGRLLYDSKSIFEDQLEAVEAASKRSGNEEVNLALLTDGLRAEREQGITIDVAYRYFATPKRKFIIADTPGHIQYTRNMVTGASTADLAILLVDARHGIVEQTLRHSFIASLLGIPYVVVCINKMDLVDFSQEVYDKICNDYSSVANKLHIENVRFIPISAKYGHNVVTPSDKMPWYNGQTLMDVLETTPIDHKINSQEVRMPVQYVIRPISDKFPDFRGYAGRMAGGILKVGDEITVFPSALQSKVKDLSQCTKELQEVFTPDWITIQLENDIDISRGDLLAGTKGVQPQISQDITMDVCWFNENPLMLNARYIIRQATSETIGIIKKINYKVNINTLEHEQGISSLNMNDIASVTIKTANPLVFDLYKHNRTTGSLIFIDQNTFETVGAGMISDNEN
ncbi:sulfate adenylyltransferase subunit 1 [Bacteroides sp. UBA939]|uniref:sulfate adenylyltransferase subunit 1 n=1 Tax=Bacteroides sp. UBA939 TaxID=1946092 RepID=UPI0025C6ECD3|nr:GTP-binding protein [Bacteroides sp. UBA939]